MLQHVAFGRTTDLSALATYSAPGLDARDHRHLQKAFGKLLTSADQKLSPGRQLERTNDESRIFCSRSPGDGVFMSLVFAASLDFPQDLGFAVSLEALALGMDKVHEGCDAAALASTLTASFEAAIAKYHQLARCPQLANAAAKPVADEAADGEVGSTEAAVLIADAEAVEAETSDDAEAAELAAYVEACSATAGANAASTVDAESAALAADAAVDVEARESQACITAGAEAAETKAAIVVDAEGADRMADSSAGSAAEEFQVGGALDAEVAETMASIVGDLDTAEPQVAAVDVEAVGSAAVAVAEVEGLTVVAAATEPQADELAAVAKTGEKHEVNDERSLPTTLLREGPLCMRKRKGFELRYFKLFDNRLEYFKRAESAARGEEPRGILWLADVRGLESAGECVTLSLDENELSLVAPEGASLAGWISDLESMLGGTGTGVLLSCDSSDQEELPAWDELKPAAQPQSPVEALAVDDATEDAGGHRGTAADDAAQLRPADLHAARDEDGCSSCVESAAFADASQAARFGLFAASDSASETSRPSEVLPLGGEAPSPRAESLCCGQFLIEKGGGRKQSSRFFVLYEDHLAYHRAAGDFRRGCAPSGLMAAKDIEDVEVNDTGFLIRMQTGAEFILQVAYVDGVAGASLEEWHSVLARVFGDDTSVPWVVTPKPCPDEHLDFAQLPETIAKEGIQHSAKLRRAEQEVPFRSGDLVVVRRAHEEVQFFVFLHGRIEYFADRSGASLGLCLGRVLADDVRQVRVNNEGFSLVTDQRSMELRVCDGDDLEEWLAALRKVLGCGEGKDEEPIEEQPFAAAEQPELRSPEVGTPAFQATARRVAPQPLEDEEWEADEAPLPTHDELDDTIPDSGGERQVEVAQPVRVNKFDDAYDEQGSDGTSTATAESSEAASAPGVAHAFAGARPCVRKLREPFILDGPLKVARDGKLAAKYSRLFKDRLDLWAYQENAVKGMKPDSSVSLHDFYGLETIGSGFLLKHRSGHKTGINVGDNTSLREWCSALLLLLADDETSCPSASSSRRPSTELSAPPLLRRPSSCTSSGAESTASAPVAPAMPPPAAGGGGSRLRRERCCSRGEVSAGPRSISAPLRRSRSASSLGSGRGGALISAPPPPPLPPSLPLRNGLPAKAGAPVASVRSRSRPLEDGQVRAAVPQTLLRIPGFLSRKL